MRGSWTQYLRKEFIWNKPFDSCIQPCISCSSSRNVLDTQNLLKEWLVHEQGSRIPLLLKSRVQSPINSEFFSLPDLPPLFGAPAALGTKTEFVLSSSQVNKLKMPFDNPLWFMISCLKKLECVNHPFNGSYIPTEGSQQKGMCVSSSERVKTGKVVMNNTQQWEFYLWNCSGLGAFNFQWRLLRLKMVWTYKEWYWEGK